MLTPVMLSRDIVAFVQAIHDPILIIDENGIVQMSNRAAERVLGYTDDGLIGQDIHEILLLGDSSLGVVEFFENHPLIAGSESTDNRPTPWSVSVRKGDGTWIMTSCIGTHWAGAGAGVRIIIFPELWRPYEERARQAGRIANLGSFEQSLSRNDVWWSEEMYHIFGIQKTPPITVDRFLKCVHPDDREGVVQGFKAASQGTLYNAEFRVVRPDGEIRYVHAQGDLIYEHDQVVSIVGTLQDITERKRVEEDLRRSKNNLKLAQRIAKLGHWDLEIETDDLYWSDEMYRIWDTSPERFPLTLEAFIATAVPEDAPRLERAIRTGFQGDAFDLEFRITRPDGSLRTVHLMGDCMRDEGDRPTRIFGTVQDVTEQRKTDELLLKSEKLSAVGQLAAGVAHEIRNPLTALKGFTQLLHQGTRGSRRRYFDIMLNELNRIELILSELLVLAKPQAVHVKPKDIGLMLHEVIALLGTQAVMKNVMIETQFPQNIPLVDCEGNQLKQVFVNVIKNAIEAMPNGGRLFIELRVEEDKLQITFTDEGIGIPHERIPKLGEPFYTTKDKGTGLGLMISHKIVETHQGHISIMSEVGQGTTVEIVLPISLNTIES